MTPALCMSAFAPNRPSDTLRTLVCDSDDTDVSRSAVSGDHGSRRAAWRKSNPPFAPATSGRRNDVTHACGKDAARKNQWTVLSCILTLGCATSQARPADEAQIAPPLPNLTVYAKTYVTQGAGSAVRGNVASGDVATMGANATVAGNLSSVKASNTGANGKVGGNLASGGLTTLGAGAAVAGNATSVGAATLAAGAHVAGSLVAGGVTTLGNAAVVQGSVSSGDTASLGVNSHVFGSLSAVGLISMAGGSVAGSQSQLLQSPIGLDYTVALAAENLEQARVVGSAHAFLGSLGGGTSLATTMTTNMTLFAGVYSAANFSTTAGTTLTLDGQGLDNQTWVFNFADYLVTGASTNVVLINGGLDTAIYWNTSGYAALGATSTLLGTVIATDYISVGAGTTVSGIGSPCGGVFSTTSYVSTGADAVIGGVGCSASPKEGALPEPTSSELVLAGLALLAFELGAGHRRLHR